MWDVLLHKDGAADSAYAEDDDEESADEFG